MSATGKVRRTIARPMLSALGSAGVLGLYARAQGRAGAVILMYHSVARPEEARWIDPQNHVGPEVFREQMAFLARERRVVSLSSLIDMVREGQTAPAGTVVISFDDGYLDNLTVAAPILAEFGLPAMLFVPTGYIDRGENQWIDVAWSAFEYRTCERLVVGDGGGGGREYHLSDATQRAAAYRAICQSLMSAPHDQRRAILADVLEQLRPNQLPPRLTMTWDDVRRLLADHPSFEIGGHTVEHTDMSACPDASIAAEIAGCRDRIAAELGRLPRHFSFPYGRATPAARAAAASAGFESACGGGTDPLTRAGSDRFALRRVAAPPTLDRFSFLTSPANTGLAHRLWK